MHFVSGMRTGPTRQGQGWGQHKASSNDIVIRNGTCAFLVWVASFDAIAFVRSPHPKHPTVLSQRKRSWKESTTNGGGEESKQAQKPTREREREEGGREGDQPTWEGLLAVLAGGKGREGREEGGSQPTGHLSEAPIKYPAKNISRDLWLLSKGENTLEKLSQTLQAVEASERESEEEAGGAQTQPRADRHAPRSLPLLHEPTFGKCSLPLSLLPLTNYACSPSSVLACSLARSLLLTRPNFILSVKLD